MVADNASGDLVVTCRVKEDDVGIDFLAVFFAGETAVFAGVPFDFDAGTGDFFPKGMSSKGLNLVL